MKRIMWMVGTFAAMYLIATIVGFATYFLLSVRAMWICVFTLMPIVSAGLIYAYLQRLKVSRDATFREASILVAVWIVLSFSLDAITYIVVIPMTSHRALNWTFFLDQSPWIWLSYAVLSLSAYAGRGAYLMRLDTKAVQSGRRVAR
ncbi:hypothetical protein RBB75_12610 [Tunturibacter empetritectus]|uniref:Uncharacterized protein n=1 Tax=Tunturiibacter empetritectus TaxID=3069691 RepID=A0AAU7Z8N9_9BACT